MSGQCELCQREVRRLTKHHLIPVARHGNKKNKKLFDRQEVHARVAWLCRPCHSFVHRVLDEKTLEREYNTLEKIAAQPEIAKFTAWLRQRPDGTPVRGGGRRNRR